MNYIDLHTHTTASDGTDTPTELIKHAISFPLKAIAITDHDTVSGIQEALDAAKGTDLFVIPGIELSCLYNGKEIHMLGYFVDYKEETFLQALEQLKRDRELRNEQMQQKLAEHNMPLTMEEIQGGNPNTIITRAHFARALEEKEYVKSKDEAFQKYIGDGCCCYVQKPDFSPADAISVIQKAGGVAVLAHPMLYKMGYEQLRQLLSSLKEQGLVGVEVYHSSHNAFYSSKLRELMRPYDLLPTGGSDYHGTNKQNVFLGKGYGSLRVPYALLEDLMARCQKEE